MTPPFAQRRKTIRNSMSASGFMKARPGVSRHRNCATVPCRSFDQPDFICLAAALEPLVVRKASSTSRRSRRTFVSDGQLFRVFMALPRVLAPVADAHGHLGGLHEHSAAESLARAAAADVRVSCP